MKNEEFEEKTKKMKERTRSGDPAVFLTRPSWWGVVQISSAVP